MFDFRRKKCIEELRQTLDEANTKIIRLEKQNSAIQAILASMVEGVIAVDKTMRIVSVNPTIEKIFDTKKQDAQGKFFLEVIRNNDLAEVISAVLENKEVISKELVLVWPVQKTFQVNASPILEKNIVSGCLVVIHDITQIRRLEKVRRDFVANVSHELKTPLTSIKGFVETLLEGALEDKENSRNFLKIIQDHAGRLEGLINDLLDLSHIESQEIILKTEKLNIKDLTDEVLVSFKSQINKKSIEARNELPFDLHLNADREKIRQVLANLIDNAIKFNKEKGFIRIYAQEVNGKIKVFVEDSGIGIPPKDLPRIFERFYRVDKARSRELGGTGLGLSIVKHIVELHGGSVGVESTEGLGSKFYFTIPQ